MPTFKAKIRKRRSNGFHSVYILCTHNRELVYIKTDLVVQDSGVSDNGDIIDQRILMRTSALICSYYDKLQGKRIDNLTAKEVVSIITDREVEDIPFVSFAEAYIRKLSGRGVKRADNYRYALNSFLSFAGKPSIGFSEVTSKLLRQWIESLAHTKRVKTSTPRLGT